MPLGTDQRIAATEDMVGKAHATKTDTLNRLALVALQNDGVLRGANYMINGQCRLARTNATTLTLSRFGGANVLVKDADGWFIRTIASAGITLANTGLVASTLYYIYLYDSSGTLTLEASTTAHSTDTDTGVEIKTGDATRTLVGMVLTDGSTPGQFVDTATNIHVLSWFNRRAKAGNGALTADRSTSSTSYVELNSETRVNFLTWGQNAVLYGASGAMGTNDTNYSAWVSVGFDGTTAENVACRAGANTTNLNPFGLSGAKSGLSEGSHYATLLGKSENALGTASVRGNADATLSTNLHVVTWG
ncbi:MAG: hypothetical protein HY724_05695 [Candidatus Rokubacteria bacterium]|nr:hypothetical protein [Candidatus Rokubacteria bacterium]